MKRIMLIVIAELLFPIGGAATLAAIGTFSSFAWIVTAFIVGGSVVSLPVYDYAVRIPK